LLLLSITYSFFAGLHLPIVCQSRLPIPSKDGKGLSKQDGRARCIAIRTSGAKVLHFSGKRVGRRAESDAVACVAASPFLLHRCSWHCALCPSSASTKCTFRCLFIGKMLGCCKKI